MAPMASLESGSKYCADPSAVREKRHHRAHPHGRQHESGLLRVQMTQRSTEAMSFRMTRNHQIGRLVFLLWLAFAVPLAFAGSKTARCEGIKQRYVFYVPEAAGQMHPVVLLLHGAGDIPENMIDAWKKFAKQNAIVL